MNVPEPPKGYGPLRNDSPAFLLALQQGPSPTYVAWQQTDEPSALLV